MIEIEDVKPGVHVWWKADRATNMWSCPAVITEVDEDGKYFKVRTFDDFKEVKLKMQDDVDMSSRHEMNITSIQKVREYFAETIESQEKQIEEIKCSLEKAENHHIKYKKTVEKELERISFGI